MLWRKDKNSFQLTVFTPQPIYVITCSMSPPHQLESQSQQDTGEPEMTLISFSWNMASQHKHHHLHHHHHHHSDDLPKITQLLSC